MFGNGSGSDIAHGLKEIGGSMSKGIRRIGTTNRNAGRAEGAAMISGILLFAYGAYKNYKRHKLKKQQIEEQETQSVEEKEEP